MFRSRVVPSRPRHPNTDTVPLIPAARPSTGEDGSAPVFVDSTGRRAVRRVHRRTGTQFHGRDTVRPADRRARAGSALREAGHRARDPAAG